MANEVGRSLIEDEILTMHHVEHFSSAQDFAPSVIPEPERVWFDNAWNRFLQAERASQPVEPFYFHLAGRVICLRFAGPALFQAISAAFQHLACESVDNPALTVCCWDDASTGVTTPEPVFVSHTHGTEFVDASVRLSFEPACRLFSGYDPDRKLGLLQFTSVESVPGWVWGSPAREILHWWSSGEELQLVHAAAVGTPEGVALLVGRGGSGKSTTALACLGSSLQYLSDDYCLLSFDGEPRVHSLYGTAKADANSIARLPRLQASFAASRIHVQGKTVIHLTEYFPQLIREATPLRALVVPKIGGDCRLEPLSAAAALRSLAPSTMFQLAGDRSRIFERLADLVRRIPCWQLTLGPDPDAAQPLLADLVSREVSPR